MISGRRKYDHVSDVIDGLGWLSVDSLHKYHLLIVMRKMLATSDSQCLTRRLITKQSTHRRDTHQSEMIVTPARDPSLVGAGSCIPPCQTTASYRPSCHRVAIYLRYIL